MTFASRRTRQAQVGGSKRRPVRVTPHERRAAARQRAVPLDIARDADQPPHAQACRGATSPHCPSPLAVLSVTRDVAPATSRPTATMVQLVRERPPAPSRGPGGRSALLIKDRSGKTALAHALFPSRDRPDRSPVQTWASVAGAHVPGQP